MKGAGAFASIDGILNDARPPPDWKDPVVYMSASRRIPIFLARRTAWDPQNRRQLGIGSRSDRREDAECQAVLAQLVLPLLLQTQWSVVGEV